MDNLYDESGQSYNKTILLLLYSLKFRLSIVSSNYFVSLAFFIPYMIPYTLFFINPEIMMS